MQGKKCPFKAAYLLSKSLLMCELVVMQWILYRWLHLEAARVAARPNLGRRWARGASMAQIEFAPGAMERPT